ncbi:MAG: hypothetical protein WCP85_13535 [Mariniphaga sp.]
MSHEIISESHYHRIVALSDSEVGKIPPINPLVFVNVATGKESSMLNFKMDINLEIKKLIYANAINDLMVRFIRKDKFDESTDMLVMERLYPLDFQNMEKRERISIFERFETQINELHIKGFLHGDIEHPMRANPDFLFNNIIMTDNGLRLIDTGFSVLRKDEPDKFLNLLRGELLEIKDFKEYFLGS